MSGHYGVRNLTSGPAKIHVEAEEKMQGHVLLRMLAYHVEWYMRRRMAPILLGDDDPESAEGQRSSPAASVQFPPGIRRKADSLPVYSFAMFPDSLSTLTLITVRLSGNRKVSFETTVKPTSVQKGAFELIGIDTTLAGVIAWCM